MSTTTDPIHILQQYWGYQSFRPMQADIIDSVLSGQDTLALLPTGGGKSVCYQVPALCREGITLVISPLIALMKDQVYNLRRRNIPAAAIFSGMQRREIDLIFENACNGAYKLLYLSPERLQTELAQARIARMKVNLLAVDEAHCISQWGYDFRPPYLQIAELRTLLPQTPLMALTATATTEVLEDIQDKLAFKTRHVFRQSFRRENLSYSVLYEDKKRDKLLDILKRVPGCGVVYVRSRGETKEIAHFLTQKGISADFYHAGLPAETRHQRQEAWMTNKIRIMVCTNAFGMGIDKPDVRTVVHLNLPDSLEAYFQEAGRGGRDGQKSYAALLYTPSDADRLQAYLKTAFPPLEMVRRVYQALGSYTQIAIGAGQGETFDFDLPHFCQVYKLDHAETHSALKLLEQDGWLLIDDAGYQPARLQIIADRATLYDYQLRNKQADQVIKVILRAYPGIYEQACDINEANIASFAKLPPETIGLIIQHAHKEGILDFQPRKDKPQLTFLREKVAAENLQLDLARFQFRKQRAEVRVAAAIHYVETRRCRSQLLLTYFNEPESPPCGICDICTGRNKPEFPVVEFETYARKISDLLRREPMPAAEVLKAFAPKRQELVAQVLGYLLDEGTLIQMEDGNLNLPGK